MKSMLRAQGILVTAIAPGTSAADSVLEVNDVITIIDEDFLAGMSRVDMLRKLWGPKDASIEVTALRKENGALTRLCVLIDMDFDVTSGVGFSVKQKAGGLMIVQVEPDSDAAASELRVGDVITNIEDTFVAGLPIAEASLLLSGKLGTSISVVATRDLGFNRKTIITA